MTFDDGMSWLDEETGKTTPAPRSEAEEALEGAASVARLALFNLVRSAFDEEEKLEGLTRSALAKRMGVSSALVSRWLNRPQNMTVETAAKILFSLRREVKFSARKAGAPSRGWVYFGILPNSWHSKFSDFAIDGKGFASSIITKSRERELSSGPHKVYEAGNIKMIRISGTAGDDGLYECIDKLASSGPTSGSQSPSVIREKSSVLIGAVDD